MDSKDPGKDLYRSSVTWYRIVDIQSVLRSPKGGRYLDPSSKLWSVYVAEALQYDKVLVESWTNDMDGILIFVRIKF